MGVSKLRKLDEITEAGRYPYQVLHVPSDRVFVLLGKDEQGYYLEEQPDDYKLAFNLNWPEWVPYKSVRSTNFSLQREEPNEVLR